MFASRVGSRAEVMHGTAEMTSGGLTKSQLGYNKTGEIVSLEKQKQAKKKSNPLSKFITKARKSKGKKFTPSPSTGTTAYKKLLK